MLNGGARPSDDAADTGGVAEEAYEDTARRHVQRWLRPLGGGGGGGVVVVVAVGL